jgi:hypothetical protein
MLVWGVSLGNSSEPPVVPYHTIAFSQQKLRAALRRSAGQDPALNYGFVVHARRQNERPSLGVITLNGESLALNRRLLGGLDGVPLWLFGHARIVLGQATSVEEVSDDDAKTDDVPVGQLVMHIATFDASTGITQNLVQVEAAIRADTLVQPLLILTHARPESWPA